ncbi:hypothetical protein PG985_007468 [Apiospora marii]|uniref:Uncharacterized protein n=1 Tax=Apiospora marii TaxID=335849 RepID=A0ABR1SNI1_9PEZI
MTADRGSSSRFLVTRPRFAGVSIIDHSNTTINIVLTATARMYHVFFSSDGGEPAPKRRQGIPPQSLTAWEAVQDAYAHAVSDVFPDTPTAPTLAPLVNLPAQRYLTYRDGGSRRGGFRMCRDLNSNRRRLRAALLQAAGNESVITCELCSQKRGLWSECVGWNGQAPCACCFYRGQEKKCFPCVVDESTFGAPVGAVDMAKQTYGPSLVQEPSPAEAAFGAACAVGEATQNDGPSLGHWEPYLAKALDSMIETYRTKMTKEQRAGVMSTLRSILQEIDSIDRDEHDASCIEVVPL